MLSLSLSLSDLLGAARTAVNEPSAQHQTEFKDLSENLKVSFLSLRISSSFNSVLILFFFLFVVQFEIKQRELETISTTMLNSGLIQAAANVSNQLNNIFSETK